MTKRALCVGINAYSVKPLQGCVNDANDWASVLVDHYDFVRDDVKVLTDAGATKSGILGALKGLLTSARKGDALVFTNSAHGAQITDRNDRDESLDEVICPVDYLSGLIVDDDLRALLETLPAGVNLAVVSDSCHSGTVTRAPGEDVYPSVYSRRERFLDQDFLPKDLQVTKGALASALKKKSETDAHPEEAMREVLLAACRDDESSYDGSFGQRFGGVMTHHALQAIRDAGYRLTYEQLWARTTQLIAGTKYSREQHPQLEGRAENRARQIFT